MSSISSIDIKQKTEKIVQSGNHLMRNGRVDEAIKLYQAALSEMPRNAYLHEGIGSVYLQISQFDKAAKYLKNAFMLGRRSVKLINKLVLALSRTENHKEFSALVEKYADLKGTNAQYDLVCAIYFHMRGNHQRCAASITRARRKEPKNKYIKAVFESMRALQALGFDHSASDRPRIAFHMNEGFHYSIMKPIFDEFKDDYPVLICDSPTYLSWFKPDVIFVANSQAKRLRDIFPSAMFIYTRHGLISKNFAYDAARTCDYVCMPSEDIRQQYIEEGGFSSRQLWVTGYSQMDPLFNGNPLRHSLVLSEGAARVLYAPTFTDGISSVPEMTPLIESGKLDQGREFVIKPHPLSFRTQKVFMARLKEYANSRENVHFVDNPGEDVTPYLQLADVLISDASSVMFEYLALDRPVIAINNPQRFDSPRYDVDGIEWRWRNMTHEVDVIEELPNVLDQCLRNPQEKQEIRAKYAQRLFGTRTEGRTGFYIRKEVEALLARRGGHHAG